jgi:hypothetical protein
MMIDKCAWPDKSSGAFAFVLTFLLHFFCQEKKWKNKPDKDSSLKQNVFTQNKSWLKKTFSTPIGVNLSSIVLEERNRNDL